MKRYALVGLFLAAFLLIAAGGRSDEHKSLRARRSIVTATPSAVPTGTPTPQPAAQSNAAEPSPTVTPSPTPTMLCQICIDVSGTPQWPNECGDDWWLGTPCTPAPTETLAPYP